MAQFDVYKNENPQTNQTVPFLLDIQNDILKSLQTRVVIPLSNNYKPIKGITKEFFIENQKVAMITTQMGTVHINELENKISNLNNHKDEIKNSLDFLVYGF
jgi:toxin CcdB